MTDQEQPLSERRIRSLPIAAVDFETTGLNPADGDRAVEIAIVKLHPDGTLEQWAALINPSTTIPLNTQQIHGITNRMVASARPFSEIRDQIAEFLTDCIFIAHNAEFDLGFLESECQKSNCQPIQVGPVLDTLQMSRNFFGLPRNNLTSVANRFQMHVHNAHRALHDAHNTLYSFIAMLDDLDQRFGSDMSSARLQQLIAMYDKDGPFKKQIRRDVILAKKKRLPIVIEYVSGDPNKPIRSKRTITISKIDFPHIIAHCHLRNAERTFRLRRIQQATLGERAASPAAVTSTIPVKE